VAKNSWEGALISDGGSSAEHREASVPYVVAPTAAPDVIHTLRPRLRPAACWRIDDLRFDFDSSFLLPSGTHEFQLLARQRPPKPAEGAPVRLLSVFGHADPSGQDDYNKVLSGRRATSVYALLTRDTALWEKLYSVPHGGDKWGIRQVQLMLTPLGFTASQSGFLDSSTTKAVKDFQKAQGLPASGFPDAATRAQLFLAYMDVLCVDDTGTPFRYRKEDFLSRGGGAGGKMDYQGCGEFNPVRVFSEEAAARFEKPANKAERNAQNASNRRVVIYMFDAALGITAAQWPCPTATEGGAGCRAQFWPDGDARRSPRGAQREHLSGGRTFACAFYDRLARGSPCEGVRGSVIMHLLDHEGRRMGARPDSPKEEERLQGAPYRLTIGSQVREGRASAEGVLIEQNLYLGGHGQVEWGAFPDVELAPSPDADSGEPPPQFLYSRSLFLSTGSTLEPDTARQLFNLGYTSQDAEENQRRFLADYSLEDGETFEQAVDRVHQQGLEREPR
jgi:outer membrane protein OmpA-like peptidoglycan-associated protein